MQEQTPVSKRRKTKRKPRATQLGGNNPYQQVQPKTNNLPGFNFPGAVM